MTQLTSPDGTPASRYAFGTMQFGGKADEMASAAMFDDACAAGITHFDTAFIYTGGSSERILGQLLGQRRDGLLVASKIAYDGIGDPAKLQDDFDESRNRLGLEQLDILYLHQHVGADLPRALDWLVQQQSRGTVRYIGLSNFAAWQVMDAQCQLHAMGSRVDILQPMYNLVKRQAEVEILPMCADQGIACAPYSPLGGGLLTGKYATGESGRIAEDDRYSARYALPYMHETAVELAALANLRGIHPATLAAAWVARHPSQPSPILSARSSEQLAPSLAAMTLEMDDALYAQISALSPAPPPATDRLEERT